MSCNQIRVRICRCSILKCCKRNTKTYIYEICYNNQGIFSKYETNLKTMILQRSLKSLGLLLSLFEFNNFSSLIDIIDKIIDTHYQNTPMAVQYHCHVIQTETRDHDTVSVLQVYFRHLCYITLSLVKILVSLN